MATAPFSHMASIEDFAVEQGLNFLTPSHPDFDSTRRSYIRIPSPPLAIVQPKTELQVAGLLKLCTTLNIPFSVRTGGHDHVGRGMVPSSLCIDMRSIAYVRLSDDHSTARIGGGTLLRQVADELAEHGLVTTLGNIGSVGYAGFATIAGYGPLGPKFGLAVDQIVGARIVDAQGRIRECEENFLVGIRGGGPALGIILELTIKVYPLQQASNRHYCPADTDSDSF